MPNDDVTAREVELLARLIADLKSQPTAPAEPPEPEPIEVTDIAGLEPEVRRLRLGKGKPFIIRQRVAKVVSDLLYKLGKFIHGDDGHRFYFYDAGHILLDLDSEEFAEFLAAHSGIVQTEKELFDYVVACLRNKTSGLRPTKVGALSHFDRLSGAFYMANGPAGMLKRWRGGEWRTTHNGDGFIFSTSSKAEGFTPDFTANGAALDRLFDLASLHHKGGAALSVNDQKILFRTWFFFNLYGYETRMILVAKGEKGSGKTSACQNVCLVLHGRHFEVVLMQDDRKIEDVIISLCNRESVVFDNVDTRIKGLENALAVYSTGGVLGEHRTLYHNNRPFIQSRKTKLLFLTSRDPRFNRDDVAERSVPLSFAACESGVFEETRLKELILAWRHVIMGDILSEIARIADKLEHVTAPLLGTRMADFASFGWVMHAHQEGGEWVSPEWEILLGKLKIAQDLFVAADSGLITALYDVFKGMGERMVRLPQRDLFQKCLAVGESRKLILPRSAATFGKLLVSMHDAIETELGVTFTIDASHADEHHITMIRKGQKLPINAGYLNGVSLAGATESGIKF